ncbi:hypothetical protein GJ744_010265 [Endocarpon pusillum]|uniref:Uncharacterized protein n=1 Tax=Endocarpon pusillum TaxID=364733 RepID=A0A8H7E3S8_9EURO|nr:hypothetical protein GJ744_010265 [Endocarpon pusillum]
MPSIFRNFLEAILPAWFSNTTTSLSHPPNTDDNNDKNMYHPSSAREVYHVAFLLRQILVADLVPIILDLAEYWPKTTYSCQESKSYVQHTAGRPYLSAVLSNAVGGPRMIRKIEIHITSHDQGWSSYSQHHGTYNGSWTWFEAEVRPAGSEDEDEHCVKKELCRNVHADAKDKTHTSTWRYDAEDEGERDLVRSLGPGSSISVVPWAMFPGWQNYVTCASVDVYAVAVRKL